jgi:outer membrane receptor protein involved in Fe transport
VAVLVVAVRPSPSWAQTAGAAEAPAEVSGAAVEPGAEAETPAEPKEEAAPEAGAPRVAPPSDVEVIRIKGRAVTGIETEVPASVTQFDAEDIQALGAQNISDLAKVTPNVEIKTAGSTAPTFFIRGVGLSDFSANAAGAVAIYQDDVAINAPAIQLTPLYDLENVEVLRGPQSVACCRNASAGAIKIYSRKPTGELGAELRSTVGNYGLKDFEGAIAAPIVEEMLATRLAFRWTERGPIAENRCADRGSGPGPPIGGAVARVFNPDGTLNPDLSFQKSLETYTPPDARLPPRAPNYPNPLPPPPPQQLNPSILGPTRGPSFCSDYANTPVANPRFDPSRFRLTSGVRYDYDGDPEYVNVSGIPGDLEGDVNDIGNWAARGQLRFQPPGTEMDWLLKLHGSRVDQLSTLGQAIGSRTYFGGPTANGVYVEPDQAEELAELSAKAGNEGGGKALLAEEIAQHLDKHPFEGDYDRTGKTTLDTWGSSLRGEWAIGPVNLSSVSAYDTYSRFRDTDQDFTPDILFEGSEQDDAWQFFQELRATGELAELPFRWEVGGFYLMENLQSMTDALFSGGQSRQHREYTQDVRSLAGYAGFSWDFLDDFTLEGGVRYNWDRKDFDFSLTNFPNAPQTRVSRLIGRAPTGNLTLTYRFTEDVSAYWKYTRGWKPGTFNSIAQLQFQAVPAEPETIDAFETGVRGSYLDGRLQLGGALFYYSYTDYQVFVVDDNPLAPPTLQIINANDAEVYGAEVDLRAEPLAGLAPSWLEGLVLTGRFGWLKTQFLDFTNQVIRQPAPGLFIQTTVDYTGNPLINSPTYKASVAAEWTFDLGRYGALIPRYDFAWSSDIFFDPNEGMGSVNQSGGSSLPEFGNGQPAYWLHNARLAYRTPEGNVEVGVWVRNFMDKIYKTYSFDASVFSGVVINFVGEPRTYGLDFIVRF